jgi:hypothetical protein
MIWYMIRYDIRCDMIYGMIWYMIRYDVYDMIYGMIWHNMTWYGTTQHNTIRYDIWCDMIYDIGYDIYDMIYGMMIWHNMTWYDTTQHNTIRYDMIWYDMIWYDIFINFNWVVTRWQYTFTHKQYKRTQITTNVEECRPCPVFASFTLAFALQLRKKHGKPSDRLRKTSVGVVSPKIWNFFRNRI